MSKNDPIPYYDEQSKLHLLYLLSSMSSFQVIRFSLADLFAIVFISLTIVLTLIPFFVTLRWDHEQKVDSWNRVVVKRLRDTSFSLLVVFVALAIMFQFIDYYIYWSTFSFYFFLWLVFLLYYHSLYQKLLSIQNVSSSVDAKRWREDWTKDISILVVGLVIIGVMIYFN
ncbi:hypothetical protein [Alkalicoccobacillus gibsonii]|uniref:hypothetical protein n=1 Tax=Alkalicoccobacillus gibsonii TaxID=79881 RepID=UPI00193256B8|nr:hypothetical protein [Alkalicoccobacillus gibsonii]MBM0067505.1 hypothetical protein [Alkalicoccobacillus gibsonii]